MADRGQYEVSNENLHRIPKRGGDESNELALLDNVNVRKHRDFDDENLQGPKKRGKSGIKNPKKAQNAQEDPSTLPSLKHRGTDHDSSQAQVSYNPETGKKIITMNLEDALRTNQPSKYTTL
jgi:hypothetical protein